MRRSVAVATATIGTCSALLVSACGDPVTAQRSFYVVATVEQTVVELPAHGGYLRVHHLTSSGMLVDGPATKRAIPGTSFRQECTTAQPSSVPLPAPVVPAQPLPAPDCTLLLNTGAKVYAAAGTSGDALGPFTGLGTAGNTMQLQVVGSTGQPHPTTTLRVTLRP